MTKQHHLALDKFSFLFSQDGGYLRIPIWGHIPLSDAARQIIEFPDFVRLSRIRQLGLVYYVFPGASHTRFEHSIGTYYLSVLMLQRLVLNPVNWDGENPKISPEEASIFLAAALLHDIGHYPFAHLVDKLQGHDGDAFRSHEDRAKDYILSDHSPGSIYAILRDSWGIESPETVVNVISNPFNSGLPGRMLSGILDPDKMDYLLRDAWACGVPYGNIDTDRLIESLVLDEDDLRKRLAITEKGIAPLESLVFAKYMMFRHIYWHHAVRIAVAMLTRFVQDGLDAGIIDTTAFYNLPDDALIDNLSWLAGKIPSGDLIRYLRERRLYKRGITFYPEHAVGEDEFAITGDALDKVHELYYKPELRREKEFAICRMLSKAEGLTCHGHEVLLDIPRVSSVFDLADFRDLNVNVSSQIDSHNMFVPFNSYGFTQLTADFAQEFERYSRRIQIACHPDLRKHVLENWQEIKAVVME